MSSPSQQSAVGCEPAPARHDDTCAPVPARAAGLDGAAAERLLSELAPLPHRQRVCAAVDHVRALPPAEVPGLLGVLADPDRQVPHVRALALICARSVPTDPAHGAGLTAVLTAGLTDPHRYVRTQALTALAAGLITPDPELLLADHVTGAARRDLIGRLRRPAADSADPGAIRRLADALVEPLRETWGDHEAARLLPGCSAETVRRLLPLLHHVLACWPALTRRHPMVVWEWLAREAESLPEAAREEWWRFRAAPALTALAAVQPVRVLDLFALHGPARLPPGLLPHLPRFLTHAPRRVARLWREDRLDLVLTSLTDAAARRFVRSLPEDELLATVRHPRSTVTVLTAVLGALPPGRRGPVLDATRSHSPRGARLARTVSAASGLERPPIPQDLLRLLPCRTAAPHVRHALAAARERGATPAELFLLRGLLPYEDAAPALLAGTRRSDTDERGAAWRALVACAARSRRPAAVAEVVAELAERLRSEQDPVRTQALGALSSVPPGLFAEATPAALHRIATDTLEARDRSFGSLTALATLARRVACAHGVRPGPPGAPLLAWAVQTLLRTDGAGHSPASGAHTLGTLRRKPPAGAVEALVGGLRPLVTAALDAGDPAPVLTLAETLADLGGSGGAARRGGRSRPEGTPWLWKAVERVLTGTSDERAARRSADLWLAPATLRRSRVRALLAAEPSAIALPRVVETVARDADDLLPLLLAHPLDAPPAGRFHPVEHIGRPHERYPLPPVVRAAHRWTGAACAAVADWLVAGLRTRHPDAGTATDGVGGADVPGDALLRALAAVPGSAGIAEVRALATARDVATAEAALAALPYADRPALVLPDLLARAADDRARVAVYAIGRVCPHVAPKDLAARFRPVLARSEGSKVTSRKEIVRLAADRLPAALAGEALVAAFTAPGQHPDVRAAAATRAAALTALEPVAACLDDIARRGSASERAALLRVSPWQLSGPARQRYAALVNVVCHSLLTASGAVHAEGAASTAADNGQEDGPTPQQTAETCRVLYRWAQAEPSTVHLGLLPRLVADPRAAGPVWGAAAVTMVDAARQDPGGAGTVLTTLLAELLGAGAGEPHHAAVRHRVEALTRELERWAGQRLPDACRPVWERACALLVAQDATLRLGTGLRTTLGPGAGSDHEAWLRKQARLVRDRPLLAARTARAEARRAGRPTASGLRADLARARSAAAPDALFTGLYALARAEEELGAARSVGGDTATAMTALTELCGHPAPDVRDAAAEAAGRP
ncbi:hypothetical protein HYE82_05010 [Streptomyces sp. BR123]|uniref:hypothetical protein n=1 Tax=Streptomyces sp. BR123 TaxID=2749828 RepID=UPI0015C4E50A|nr:hypothetical protein [Streptomyces sp. BR123]NXY93767.1 hypothetical protein [Streptomyces sp. BR123]